MNTEKAVLHGGPMDGEVVYILDPVAESFVATQYVGQERLLHVYVRSEVRENGMRRYHWRRPK